MTHAEANRRRITYPPPRVLERRIAVRARTAQGESAREIAESLGITERSVVRMRARLRELGKLKEA